jgi:Fe-S-cluster containining protein
VTEAAFGELESVYADLEAELRRLAPICRTSGECCRFVKSGHRLFTTPLELDYLRARAGFAGARAERVAEGVCPFLRDGRCGVRDHRMLGCRVYFCDPRYASDMPRVYEAFHGRVKDVMRRHGIAYAYFDFLSRIGTELATRGAPA